MKRPDLWTPAEVGAACSPPITSGGVKKYDAKLKPLLTRSGRRLYLRESVEAFLTNRDIAAGTRDQRARTRGRS